MAMTSERGKRQPGRCQSCAYRTSTGVCWCEDSTQYGLWARDPDGECETYRKSVDTRVTKSKVPKAWIDWYTYEYWKTRRQLLRKLGEQEYGAGTAGSAGHDDRLHADHDIYSDGLMAMAGR